MMVLDIDGDNAVGFEIEFQTKTVAVNLPLSVGIQDCDGEDE